MTLNESVNKKCGTSNVNYLSDMVAEQFLTKDSGITISANDYEALNGKPIREFIAEKNGNKYTGATFSEAICKAFVA